MRPLIVSALGAVFLLAGCATIGVGDKYKNAGVVCGTHIGLGFTERIGAANLEKGVILDGGSITCAPDGTLTITSGTAPVKVPKETKP